MKPESTSFLTAQILATEQLIDALQTAVLALTTGRISSYSLDTGQSVQSVTKANIGVLDKAIDSAYNRLSMLCVRRDGGGSVLVRPGF